MGNELQDARGKPRAVRKEVYIGESLYKLLRQRPKVTLSTLVNMLATRYAAMTWMPFPLTTTRVDDVLLKVLAERTSPLPVVDINHFTSLVNDWCERNPMNADEAHYPAVLAYVNSLNLNQRFALIERLEKIK